MHHQHLRLPATPINVLRMYFARAAVLMQFMPGLGWVGLGWRDSQVLGGQAGFEWTPRRGNVEPQGTHAHRNGGDGRANVEFLLSEQAIQYVICSSILVDGLPGEKKRQLSFLFRS